MTKVDRATLPVEVMVAGAVGEGLVYEAKEAAKRFQKLSSENPSLSPDALCKILITNKIKFAALSGLFCALPIFILSYLPVFVMFFSLSCLAGLDMLAIVKLSSDLTLELHSVSALNPSEPQSNVVLMNLILAVWGLNGLSENSTNEETKQAGEFVLFRLGEEVFKRLLLVFFPLVGIVVCIVLDVYELYVLGNRAKNGARMPLISAFFPTRLVFDRLPRNVQESLHMHAFSVGNYLKLYFSKTWGRALKN